MRAGSGSIPRPWCSIQFAETANGTVSGAAIRLDSLVIGSIDMNRLPATVNGADMSESLLGMEFLNRLHGWRVENGVLTLRSLSLLR